MYIVTKNTKLISFALMLIGVFAMAYGFIKGAGHHSDEEVAHQVHVLADQLDQSIHHETQTNLDNHYSQIGK